MDSYTDRVKKVLKKIPKGKVATYGQVAAMAGNPRGARQVVWVLHSSAEREKLPWYRVVNSKGRIALPESAGYELQQAILKKEKIQFRLDGSIDLARFQWCPRTIPQSKKNT
jgi:methylated-DNA-protein-cysteine methyltransferase related protein